MTTAREAAATAAAADAAVETTAATKVVTPQRPGPWGRFRNRFDHKVVPYILVSPFFILFLIFGLYPLVYNGVVSLQRYRLDESSDLRRFIGFENYVALIGDPRFWNALLNTFGIFILATVPQLLLALVIASLLNRRLRAQNFLRVGILLPYVTPIVASSLLFSYIFSRQVGLANTILGWVGIQSVDGNGDAFNGIDWRATRFAAWTAIATMVNWKWIGYNGLLYLAAMQAIPKDVYEAAALDGAGPWKQLWRITFPMIRPMVIFTVVLSTIGGLQLFTEPMLFDENPVSAQGGALAQWQTIAQLIYQTGWKRFNLGYAAAMSWALFFIIVVLAGINALITNRLGGGKR